MNYRDGMESYDFESPRVRSAILTASQRRRSPVAGRWTIGTGAFMFHETIQSQFPVAARVLDAQGNPAASGLDPDHVAATLLPAFSDLE